MLNYTNKIMTEREQEIQVSLYADKMLRQALDIEDNNILIAEFMGLNIDRGVQSDYMEHELEYHTSWDWLMPVIDKCYQEHMSKHIADAVMTCNIDEAYKVVVEFIKEG